MFEIIADIGIAELLAIWLTALFASVLRAFTGFGFALTAVPVFALFLAPVEAVVLSASLTLLSSLLTMRTFWAVVPLRPMLPLGLMSILGTSAGTLLLNMISPEQFRLWVGLSVIFGCAWLSFVNPSPSHNTLLLRSGTGLLSGLMNGALTIPGPPMIVYAMLTEPQPERSRALLMTFFLFSAMVALVSFALAGFSTLQSLWYLLWTFPAVRVGGWLGGALFKRFGDVLYRRIGLVSLLCIGLTITLGSLIPVDSLA